jgi:hypothetical protein
LSKPVQQQAALGRTVALAYNLLISPEAADVHRQGENGLSLFIADRGDVSEALEPAMSGQKPERTSDDMACSFEQAKGPRE